MEHFKVTGGRSLYGELNVKSAKNAVLPIIACCIMSDEEIILKNCPKISDIDNMLKIIKCMGARAEFCGEDIYINCSGLNPKLVENNLACSIRSSIFTLGPLLAKFKLATVSYPGGCNIGQRPIDIHIEGLKSLGVNICDDGKNVVCDATNYNAGIVELKFPSVGATENIMMAAVLSKGTTVIKNAAREPEIIDLQNFINFLGGKVSGAGTTTISIEGVKKLGAGVYTPIADRIVAGTYLSACAICGGTLSLKNINPIYMQSTLKELRKAGCNIDISQGITIYSDAKILPIKCVQTKPFPGFATDMQPQLCTVLSVANGTSEIVENVFENRFKYTQQLKLMGADIAVSGRRAVIKGVKALNPTTIKAEDLRGGAALLIAAMRAQGESKLLQIEHIDRGYYMIENDLNSLGADISRVPNLDKK